MLNDFVEAMAHFRPSGWDNDPKPTVEIMGLHGFNFSSLLKKSEKSEHLIEVSSVILIWIVEPELLTTLASFAFEYTFTGKIRGLSGPNGQNMVEYGVSRFKKSGGGDKVAETDEPLAILGLLTFLERHHLTLKSHLREALNLSNASARGFDGNLSAPISSPAPFLLPNLFRRYLNL